ncbi:FH1/FH2 domain-containing protein 3 isoform X4, partial [Silurus asotus]
HVSAALGQIMLYVDGMNGVIGHPEAIQWLYTLIGSKFRLVVKTALKLLLVFVEYSESNATLLIQAVNAVDAKRGRRQWSNAMEILNEKDGVDTELLVYTMSLINKTLAALPDQDSFYDLVDVLEEQGIEHMTSRYSTHRSTDPELREQIRIYEETLQHEDDDDDEGQAPPTGNCGTPRSTAGRVKGRGLERRRSLRHSLGHISTLSPASSHRTNYNRGEENADVEEEKCVKESEENVKPPSLLASLLAQRKSSVVVPPCSEMTPPLHDSTRPQNLLPYVPHSPFHLFSYDIQEDVDLKQKHAERHARSYSSLSAASPPSKHQNDRPGLLLSSSYRQHQESLAAQRERRRIEREERLQKIEREERNKHSRDYAVNMEEARIAREERFKTAERIAAEEYEQERVRSAPHGFLDIYQSHQDHTPTASHLPEPEQQEQEEEEEEEKISAEQVMEEAAEKEEEPGEEVEEPGEEVEEPAEEVEKTGEEVEEDEVEKPGEEVNELVNISQETEVEDSGILSDKERQNEEVNEKDNCSASSISSSSSTLERE